MTEKRKEFFFLILILVLALFFRLWKINEIPPGLYPDVAIYANDALDSLQNKTLSVFYPENNGREGFWMWILAAFFYIFGASIFTIKLAAALCGTLTVFGVYCLISELFQDKRIGLFASFFLAISFWHTNLSRIGFRVITYPLLTVFAFYFLVRALKMLKFVNFLLAGIIFGLSFYTYTSFRMQVIVLPFLFFPFFIETKEKKKAFLGIFLFLITVFLVALPLGIYFLKNPQYFFARMGPISIFYGENKILNFFKSLIAHLTMFNFYGDPNLRHNIPQKPYLCLIESFLFLIGLFLLFSELIKRKKNFKEALFLISFWLIGLLPGILTKEGVPHGLRAFGAVLPTTGFSAYGTLFLWEKVKKYRFSKIFNVLFLAFLILSYYQRYFVVWAKNPDLKNAFSQDFVEMGKYLNNLPENYEKYVIVNISGVPVPYPDGIPMPAQTIMFLERTKYPKIKNNYLLPENLEKIKIEKEGVILLMTKDRQITEKIFDKFPFAKLKEEKNFVVFEIK